MSLIIVAIGQLCQYFTMQKAFLQRISHSLLLWHPLATLNVIIPTLLGVDQC